jgi:hypothetical protein
VENYPKIIKLVLDGERCRNIEIGVERNSVKKGGSLKRRGHTALASWKSRGWHADGSSMLRKDKIQNDLSRICLALLFLISCLAPT